MDAKKTMRARRGRHNEWVSGDSSFDRRERPRLQRVQAGPLHSISLADEAAQR